MNTAEVLVGIEKRLKQLDPVLIKENGEVSADVIEEFIDLKTKTAFLINFIGIESKEWPKITDIAEDYEKVKATLARLETNVKSQAKNLDRKYSTEISPLYNKVKAIKKEIHQVSLLEIKIKKYEENLASYKNCFAQNDMAPVRPKDFHEVVNSLTNKYEEQKVYTKNVGQQKEALKRELKDAKTELLLIEQKLAKLCTKTTYLN